MNNNGGKKSRSRAAAVGASVPEDRERGKRGARKHGGSKRSEAEEDAHLSESSLESSDCRDPLRSLRKRRGMTTGLRRMPNRQYFLELRVMAAVPKMMALRRQKARLVIEMGTRGNSRLIRLPRIYQLMKRPSMTLNLWHRPLDRNLWSRM